MSSWQDYYFKTTSDIITVDEDTQRVGILNETPAFTLDVNGDISGSNVISLNTIADYIEASNAYIDSLGVVGMTAMSNVSARNMYASSNISASNLISHSNLKMLNTWVSDVCPIPNQGSFFGFSLGGGVIDTSWLKIDNDFGEFLSTAWDALQTGYDLYSLGQRMLGVEAAVSNVDWPKLQSKPIYGDTSTKNFGIKGDLYIADSATLWNISNSRFGTTETGNNLDLNLSNFTNSDKPERLINFGSMELFMKEITSSNITASNLTASNVLITSNLQVPDINANKVISGSVSAVDMVRCGDFYVMPQGIYAGDPASPFSQLVIDAQGNYKGTIDRGQITNLEAFNLASAGNGNLIWGDFGQTSALNDPFANQTPLFNI